MCENKFLVKPRYNPNIKARIEDFTLADCGKCDECKIKMSKEWSHRIELENKYYGGRSAFVTLTFNEDSMDNPSLSKRDVQLFLKRLRKNLDGREIRYYAVGEYGSKHLRKHYHLILLNVDGTDHYDNNRRQKASEPIVGSNTDWHAIYRSWQNGFIDSQKPGGGCAAYVAGYVVKTNKRKHEIERLGLEPEFRLMSKALGKREIEKIANKIKKMNIKPRMPFTYIEYNGKYKKPLGRYLQQVFHSILGKLEELKKYKKIYNIIQMSKWQAHGILNAPETYRKLTEYERCAKYNKYKLKMGLV